MKQFKFFEKNNSETNYIENFDFRIVDYLRNFLRDNQDDLEELIDVRKTMERYGEFTIVGVDYPLNGEPIYDEDGNPTDIIPSGKLDVLIEVLTNTGHKFDVILLRNFNLDTDEYEGPFYIEENGIRLHEETDE